ncbi:Hsp70 family protein [Haliscomenobacter hydrossis]|uniref:Heat shock protein n=1 Tax=Haliscomenobacter hydrossis (strain ATCC 27775 / DSM 1100 / LMG 10767 / O) TaxID=760192 RepID=F4L3E9_HALH1|nr:Hsp70 family protein [Haliscomenobacter hydrossis]AEE52926.1 heat shock protein [Haliscomenobacter hydrossis DSM 1100]
MTNFIYGIDFGTTNSALAILDIRTNSVLKIFTTPSLLFFPDAQIHNAPLTYSVGEAAVQAYVESRMQGRFMKSIKRVLPNKSFIGTKIATKLYKAEDLVALILLFLKKQADEFLGQNITTAVIGRPVVFDENPEKDQLAQERLAKAVRIAGFESFYFQMEPIGAAFTYERQITKEELVLVADFGGGTSDFSIMKLRPEAINNPDRSGDMMAKGGIYIGGDSFDSDIMWHRGTPHFGRGVKEKLEEGKWIDLPLSYFTNICSWEKMNFLDSYKWRNTISKSYFAAGRDYRVKNLLTLIEKNLGYILFKQIEKAKFGLTDQDVSSFAFNEFDIQINESITIEDFECAIIHKNVAKIEAYLHAFLKSQGIDFGDIDTVFMTGGTSYVRPLSNIFTRLFGQEKIKSGDNFNSVATGIAYSYPVVTQVR